MKARFREVREDVAARVVIGATLELCSPCHVGGPEADVTSDRPLLRDSQGVPYLPGTSLAGVLRSALRGAGRDDKPLFGYLDDDSGEQARLIVSDARLMGLTSATELRDGVSIDPASGVAEERKKFDCEFLPAGTRFQLELEALLPERAAELRRDLVWLIELLERGDLHLGARTRRGFGACRLVPDSHGFGLNIACYDLRSRSGMLAWIGQGLADLPKDWPRAQLTRVKQSRELASLWSVDSPSETSSGDWIVHLDLQVSGALIVRAPASGADHEHLSRLSSGVRTFVLPGTSLAGVLRHRCRRIARTLAPERADRLLWRMFGGDEPGQESSRKRRGRASRVEVAEGVLEGGATLRHTRVSIDPWTGGARESLLFTEDLHYGGKISLRVLLRPDPEYGDVQRALLLLALRDLATSDLPVGGESGVGRGTLRAATREFGRTEGRPSIRLTAEPDGAIRATPDLEVARLFEALKKWREEA